MESDYQMCNIKSFLYSETDMTLNSLGRGICSERVIKFNGDVVQIPIVLPERIGQER